MPKMVLISNNVTKVDVQLVIKIISREKTSAGKTLKDRLSVWIKQIYYGKL